MRYIRLQKREIKTTNKSGKSFDVIIVLGGGIDANGQLAQRSLERVHKGIELFKAGLAPRIIMSGGWPMNLETRPSATEAEAMREYAVRAGVPVDKIFLEHISQDTISNCFYSKQHFLKPNGWKTLAIVTSSTHRSRALKIFQIILGPGYRTVAYDVSEAASIRGCFYEFIARRNIAKILQGIAPGDDAAVRQRLNAPDYATRYSWNGARSVLSLFNF